MTARSAFRFACCLAAAFVTIALATRAPASFRTFQIESIYSNADGTVQYVVLRETFGTRGKNAWSGQAFTSTRAGVTKTFTFPNLPGVQASNKRVLIATQGFAALGCIAPDYVVPNPDAAVEFYNATLDHCFISDLQPDIDALDTGHFPGWARTAKSKVLASQSAGGAGVNPVCRFYIPPAHGNSHFFSASPAECAQLQQKMLTDSNYSGYVYETPNAFYIALPDTATASARARPARCSGCGTRVIPRDGLKPLQAVSGIVERREL